MSNIVLKMLSGYIVAHPDEQDATRDNPVKCEREDEYIRVTPFIKGLAAHIKLPEGHTDMEVLSGVNSFINEYGSFNNGHFLVNYFRDSVSIPIHRTPSVEATGRLIERALSQKTTQQDRNTLLEMKAEAESTYTEFLKDYNKEISKYDTMISEIENIPSYNPLSVTYPPEFRSINDPNKLLYKAESILKYRERLHVINLLLRGNLTMAEKALLKSAVGMPLAPNRWYEHPEMLMSPEARQDSAFKKYYKNYDYPFSLTADELLRYKIASGCTHGAIMFMALAKALGFTDVRLVSAISNSSYNKYCKDGKESHPKIHRYVDSHKIVLAHTGERYILINPANELEVISTTYDGKPIDPSTLIGKDVFIPSFSTNSSGIDPLLRVRAVGANENDYLEHCTAENDVRVLMTGNAFGSDLNCKEFPLPTTDTKK